MKLQSFISWILSLESFSFVNIIYFDITPDLEVAQNTTNIPRMLFNLPRELDNFHIYGLPFEDPGFYFQKLSFGSRLFSIIILNEESVFDFCKLPMFIPILDFQIDSKLLVIFEDSNYNESSLIFEKGYLNTIFVNAKDFEDTQEFYTFRMFPSLIKITNKYDTNSCCTNPYIDQTDNLYGHEISVTCPMDIPNCMYSGDIEAGFMLNILRDFETFINCSLTVHNGDTITEGFVDIYKYDIYAITFFFTTNSSLFYFAASEMSSYPFERLHIFVVVPSIYPIHLSLYPFKPFSLDVWISIACVILYSTVLIKCSTIKDSLEIGDYFTRNLRLSLSQTVSFRHNHPVISFFYILFIIYGFIISTWYGAILGSYMSTFLNEKSIASFEDIKAKNLKIVLPNVSIHFNTFNKIPEFIEHEDMFDFVPFDEASMLLNTMDKRFAYSENSNHWNYFMVPQMDYYKEPRLERFKINYGTADLRIYFNPTTIYKHKFNRLLFLLKDVGLYNHYTKSVFIDCLKYNFVNYTYVPPKSEVIAIDLIFVSYVFYGWFLGIGVAFIVFIIEFCSLNISKLIKI
ncbi:hypothetical protein ACFFRR_002772 [Megaselia abdita]